MISSSHNLSCVGRRDCSDANARSQGCLSSRAGMSLLSASCREGHVWGRLCSAGHASDTHPGETCVTRENLPARAVMHQATFHIKGRRTSAFRRSGDGTSCCHLHVGIVRSKLESSSENHDSHWPCLGNVLQALSTKSWSAGLQYMCKVLHGCVPHFQELCGPWFAWNMSSFINTAAVMTEAAGFQKHKSLDARKKAR